MSIALSSGLSGLLAHQRKLDVVGNNLANVNTTGYKSRRTQFSDMVYQTVKPVSGATTTGSSGTNAVQVGSGVRISQVNTQFGQGTLQETGGEFDFAIDGGGFFVLNGPSGQNLYSRDGGFQLDATGRLIDGGSGYTVKRLGTLGDIDGPGSGFQTPGDPTIAIPFGSQLPGVPTSGISLEGNLDARQTGPVARVLSSAAPMMVGSTPATGTDLLNSLTTILTPFVAGDFVDISGTDADGTPVSFSTPVDGTTTINDLMSAIDATFPGATPSLDSDGNLKMTADVTGESFLSLDLENNPANTGTLNFATHRLLVEKPGNDGAIVNSSVEVFDLQGRSHVITLAYQKVADNEWNLTASIDPESGVIVDGQIDRIRFGEDGAFQQVQATGIGDARLIFQFAGQANPQEIQVELGTSNQFDGLTQVANASSTRVGQDGFPAGSLVEANVTADGVIEGIATNGRRVQIAQLALATFPNLLGLGAQGNNHFAETLTSGRAQIGAATTGGRGAIRIGQLEASTVDVALEFTQLIVAQRGFSASARTITVTDEILQELNGIIR